MRKAKAIAAGQDTSKDIGTLWMMRRHGHTARCALISWPRSVEVRVLVEGHTLLSEECDGAAEAFILAEGWKRRMNDKGWLQVIPSSAPREMNAM